VIIIKAVIEKASLLWSENIIIFAHHMFWLVLYSKKIKFRAINTKYIKPNFITHSLKNIFVFPSRSKDGPLTQVTLQHRKLEKTVSDYFPPIFCMYVSVRDALELYVSGKQGIVVITKNTHNHQN